MINLAEITIYYISVTFQQELQKVIYTSFSILENFGMKFYEDKYIELIQRTDSISSDTKRDSFLLLLESDIKSIIKEHYIELNTDENIDLNELNEIASFLYIIQNLEDYTLITYRLYAEDTPKNIIADIIEYLTLLTKPRILEIISNVDQSFITSLQDYISEKQDDTEPMDNKHLKRIRHFFSFINNTECLGLKYFNKGFTNVTLKELIDLIDLDVDEYIDKTIVLNAAQAGLDCLSLLIISKDSYELPLLKFKQNTTVFTNKLENVTKLESVMLSMLNDFNMFMEVKKQEEAIESNSNLDKGEQNVK